MELDKLIFSLISLAIILVLSWALNFLGKKKRNQTPQEQASEPAGEDNILLKLLGVEEGGTPQRTGQETATRWDQPENWQQAQRSEYERAEMREMKPDPIRPKWWGA